MKHKSIVEQHMGACRHFTGLMQKECKKGLVYDDLDKDCRAPYRVGLPCRKLDEVERERLGHQTQAICPFADFPTIEEAEAREKRVHDHWNQTLLARKAIVEHSEEKLGVQGKLDCPVCKTGTLYYIVAACNGHIHARCSTDDCVSWME